MDPLDDMVDGTCALNDTTDGTGARNADKVVRNLLGSCSFFGPNGDGATVPRKNPAWPFRSSEENYEKVKKAYSNSPVEEYVATAFGDEIPEMRDDLIEKKHEGEGFFERHLRAWTTFRNWKVDPDNDKKEEANPAVETEGNGQEIKP